MMTTPDPDVESVSDPLLARLIERHPKLFHGQAPRVASHVEAGWFDLIDRLCDDIEALLGPAVDGYEIVQIKEKFGTLRFYDEFAGISDLYVDLISPGGLETTTFEPSGVGGVAGSDADADDRRARLRALVDEACRRSASLCRKCGRPGTLRSGGYVQTLCDVHAEPGT